MKLTEKLMKVLSLGSVFLNDFFENNIKFFQWLTDQKRRYKKGHLSEECADMLRGVGIKI